MVLSHKMKTFSFAIKLVREEIDVTLNMSFLLSHLLKKLLYKQYLCKCHFYTSKGHYKKNVIRHSHVPTIKCMHPGQGLLSLCWEFSSICVKYLTWIYYNLINSEVSSFCLLILLWPTHWSSFIHHSFVSCFLCGSQAHTHSVLCTTSARNLALNI